MTREFEKYVGIPFVTQGRTLKGCDCWGLVRLVYSEFLKIDLPSYGEISADDLRKVALQLRAGAQDYDNWFIVKEPKKFDIVLLRIIGRMSGLVHVGVMVSDSHILHVERKTDSVILPIEDARMAPRVIGFRRHKAA